MLKSTCAFFESDKLYLVRPSYKTTIDNHVKFNQSDNDIDIGYLKDNKMYGLIKNKEYFGVEFNHSNMYLLERDKTPLLKYLFESTYNVECTESMLNHLYDIKKHYEIDELIDLYDKIMDNDQKIKKLK